MRLNAKQSRRRFFIRAALGAAALTLAGEPARTLAAGPPPATRGNPEMAAVSHTPAQTMQGFGASGAWWPNDLVRFDPGVQQSVGDMLFGERGIALSVYRYNIGGGGAGVTEPVRAPECFLTPALAYDWRQDASGRLFLRLAARHAVPILIGFVNSAPPVWTTSGKSYGGSLSPGAEAVYASFLGSVVAHLRDEEGIELSYLSPMNEPDHAFSSAGQEGMLVPCERRWPLIAAVGRQLAISAPHCRIIADESSRVETQFIPEASQWLAEMDHPSYLAALAHHLYDFPSDQTLQQARQLGERYGKPLWATEVCCFDTRTGTWGAQYDPTIGSALVLANLIWQALTQANDAAFHWWVACSSAMGCAPMSDPSAAAQANDSGWNDGLLYYDPDYAQNGNQQIYPTKRYYAMGNFSRYVRPGAQRHDVTGVPAGLRMLAFATATGWSIVIVNNAAASSAPTAFRLQLPVSKWRPLVAAKAVETSAVRNLEPVALPKVSSTGVLAGSVPAQSITTFVLEFSRGS